MSTVQIIRIPILPLGMVNSFLAVSPDGIVLIDAGLPGTEARIGTALAGIGRRFEDISLIVITHGHIDHAGNAARLRELSGAPIALHWREASFCAQEAPMTFCPTGPFGHLFLKAGLIRRPYAAFRADIVLHDEEAMPLTEFGSAGVLRASPGHTAGSLSVVMPGGDAMVGDLVASGILLGGIAMTGRPKRPPFEENPQEAAVSLQSLLDGGTTRFHMGHGGPLPAKAVARHVHHLRCLCEH